MDFQDLQKIYHVIIGKLNKLSLKILDGFVGETEKIEIMAYVQSISLDEYNQVFPQGIRTVNAVKIYTDTRLYPEKQGTPAQNADVLLYMDRKYKIITCHAYQSGVISHYKAYAQEVDI